MSPEVRRDTDLRPFLSLQPDTAAIFAEQIDVLIDTLRPADDPAVPIEEGKEEEASSSLSSKAGRAEPDGDLLPPLDLDLNRALPDRPPRAASLSIITPAADSSPSAHSDPVIVSAEKEAVAAIDHEQTPSMLVQIRHNRPATGSTQSLPGVAGRSRHGSVGTPARPRGFFSRLFGSKPALSATEEEGSSPSSSPLTSPTTAKRMSMQLPRTQTAATAPEALPEPVVPIVPAQPAPVRQDDSTPASNNVKGKKKEKVSANDSGSSQTDARLRALRMYNMMDTQLAIEDYASFLGSEDPLSVRVRQEYMELFDFTDAPLLTALRKFCSKLFIRGETQVLDRVLEGFATRWHACNPEEQLSADETHVLVFALITLNTDLHTARLEQDRQMKKPQFVQNTLDALANMAAAKEVAESGNASNSDLPAQPRVSESARQASRTLSVQTLPVLETRGSDRAASQHDSLDPRRSLDVRMPSRSTNEDQPSLVATWQKQFDLKLLLQDMYNNVKRQRILQPQGNTKSGASVTRSSSASTLATPHDNVSRSVSSASLATTTPGLSARPSQCALRNDESRGSIFVSGTGNDGITRVRPTTHGAVEASHGNSSAGVHRGMRGARPVGFANSLNKQSIREEGGTVEQDDPEADRLVLTGPPFAKEGILSFRVAPHSGDFTKKKNQQQMTTSMLVAASARLARTDCLAVCSSGTLRVYEFNSEASGSSGKRSNRSRLRLLGGSLRKSGGGLVEVGGGNWVDRARPVLEICLAHASARALRPVSARTATSATTNVSSSGKSFRPPSAPDADTGLQWVVETCDHRSCTFSVGTPELVEEWIDTVNHWAARTSQVPLLGAVGSAEFGWGWCKEVCTLLAEEEKQAQRRDLHLRVAGAPALSHTVDPQHGAADGSPDGLGRHDRRVSVKFEPTAKPRPGDRAHPASVPGGISEWTQQMVPSLPTVPGELALEQQLERLRSFWYTLSGELDEIDKYRPYLPLCWSALANDAATAAGAEAGVAVGGTPSESQLGRLTADQKAAYARAVANFDRRRRHVLSWLDKFGRYVVALESALERRKVILGIA